MWTRGAGSICTFHDSSGRRSQNVVCAQSRGGARTSESTPGQASKTIICCGSRGLRQCAEALDGVGGVSTGRESRQRVKHPFPCRRPSIILCRGGRSTLDAGSWESVRPLSLGAALHRPTLAHWPSTRAGGTNAGTAGKFGQGKLKFCEQSRRTTRLSLELSIILLLRPDVGCQRPGTAVLFSVIILHSTTTCMHACIHQYIHRYMRRVCVSRHVISTLGTTVHIIIIIFFIIGHQLFFQSVNQSCATRLAHSSVSWQHPSNLPSASSDLETQHRLPRAFFSS